MKYIAHNDEVSGIEIETGEPILTDQRSISISRNGIPFNIQRHHKWGRLTTTSDLHKLYGHFFTMESENWILEQCMVCVDNIAIRFETATLTDKIIS